MNKGFSASHYVICFANESLESISKALFIKLFAQISKSFANENLEGISKAL